MNGRKSISLENHYFIFSFFYGARLNLSDMKHLSRVKFRNLTKIHSLESLGNNAGISVISKDFLEFPQLSVKISVHFNAATSIIFADCKPRYVSADS